MAARTAGQSTPEYFAKISIARSGKAVSATTRAKMSAAQLGKTQSPEHLAKLRASHLGKKRSPEQRANISAAMTGEKNPNFGRKRSPETCAKISAAQSGEKSSHFGMKLTPEHRAKISAGVKRKDQRRRVRRARDNAKTNRDRERRLYSSPAYQHAREMRITVTEYRRLHQNEASESKSGNCKATKGARSETRLQQIGLQGQR
jgi:hypothetical protein